MVGVLYKSEGEQYLSSVDYKVLSDSQMTLWGELRPRECSRIDDGAGYIVELADKRKCQCHLKKKINAAFGVLPGSFVYSFKGIIGD